MTAIITPSYQNLVANAIIEALGPGGMNVLAWIEVPTGTGKNYIEGVFFGQQNSYNPVTHGIICRPPNEELFTSNRTSPYERWEAEYMDVVFNLYLKQDIEHDVWGEAKLLLEDEGQTMPQEIEYMTEAYRVAVRSLTDLKRNGVAVVKSIKPMTTFDRSNSNGIMPAQRKCRIEFNPCQWQD